MTTTIELPDQPDGIDQERQARDDTELRTLIRRYGHECRLVGTIAAIGDDEAKDRHLTRAGSLLAQIMQRLDAKAVIDQERPASEQLAQRFHEAYERLAPDYGYRTREASAKPWAEVPESNRQLMTDVCGEILSTLGTAPTAEPVGYCVSCNSGGGSDLVMASRGAAIPVEVFPNSAAAEPTRAVIRGRILALVPVDGEAVREPAKETDPARLTDEDVAVEMAELELSEAADEWSESTAPARDWEKVLQAALAYAKAVQG